jgi:hypothetical protein
MQTAVQAKINTGQFTSLDLMITRSADGRLIGPEDISAQFVWRALA